MTTFIGEYGAKLDDKGRVVFPSAWRAGLPSDEPMRFVIKKDIFEDCLEMYAYPEWEEQSRAVRDQLDFFNKDHATFWREYMRGRAVVQPDGKLGRISIPKALLDSIGVTKEVVFSGVDYKIEIWAKEKFEASGIPNEEYVAIAGRLSSK